MVESPPRDPPGSSSDSQPTSASLLQRARGQDDRAWNELIELYAPLVYYWCRRAALAEQDIPDVLQDVFRAVVMNIGSFRNDRPSDTFRGWLRTVTRSKLNDHFRRQSRSPAAAGGSSARWVLERVPDPQGSEDDETEVHAENALFRRVLEKISAEFDPRTWQAFWRVVVDGRSASEVAEELNMRPGTVRVAKSRVLQRLRRQLGDLE